MEEAKKERGYEQSLQNNEGNRLAECRTVIC